MKPPTHWGKNDETVMACGADPGDCVSVESPFDPVIAEIDCVECCAALLREMNE